MSTRLPGARFPDIGPDTAACFVLHGIAEPCSGAFPLPGLCAHPVASLNCLQASSDGDREVAAWAIAHWARESLAVAHDVAESGAPDVLYALVQGAPPGTSSSVAEGGPGERDVAVGVTEDGWGARGSPVGVRGGRPTSAARTRAAEALQAVASVGGVSLTAGVRLVWFAGLTDVAARAHVSGDDDLAAAALDAAAACLLAVPHGTGVDDEDWGEEWGLKAARDMKGSKRSGLLSGAEKGGGPEGGGGTLRGVGAAAVERLVGVLGEAEGVGHRVKVAAAGCMMVAAAVDGESMLVSPDHSTSPDRSLACPLHAAAQSRLDASSAIFGLLLKHSHRNAPPALPRRSPGTARASPRCSSTGPSMPIPICAPDRYPRSAPFAPRTRPLLTRSRTAGSPGSSSTRPRPRCRRWRRHMGQEGARGGEGPRKAEG